MAKKDTLPRHGAGIHQKTDLFNINIINQNLNLVKKKILQTYPLST